ncbi:MAG: hypothetical protein QHI38_06295 [Armatimonadota bacterium]|nr:hypothetical protein [Armatimonadota bacterium]
MNSSVATDVSNGRDSRTDAALVWLKLASEEAFEEWLRDFDSQAYEELQHLLPKGLIAYRKSLVEKVRAAGKLARECVLKVYEVLPRLNREVESISRIARAETERYLQESKLAKEREEQMKARRDHALEELKRAEENYAQAKARFDTLREPVERIERAKWSLACTEALSLSRKDAVVEWVIRAMIAIALGLSLGLLIGALNPYRPINWELVGFWLIGLSILTTAGETVKWLSSHAGESSELRLFQDAVVRSSGWLILTILFLGFMSIADAVVLAFGAFRLAIVASAEGGSEIPSWILLLGCFIFAFPYLCMEASYGWCDGVRKVRNLAKDALANAEQSVEELTLERLADEAAKVAVCEKELQYAKRRLDDIDLEIKHVQRSVPEPVVVFPVKAEIPGMYITSGTDKKLVVELFPLDDLPASDELKSAVQELISARDKLDAWDSEIERVVKDICNRQLQGNRIYGSDQKRRPPFFGMLRENR